MDLWRFFAALVFGPLTAIGALSAIGPFLPAPMPAAAPPAPERRIDTVAVSYSAEPACLIGQIVIIADSALDDEEVHPVHAVHAGPGEDYASIDTVRDGEAASRCEVRIAESATDDLESPSSWAGIIYGANPSECGLDAAPNTRRPYAGQCRWGWVENDIFRPVSEPRIAER
jgi:hypothetical protein